MNTTNDEDLRILDDLTTIIRNSVTQGSCLSASFTFTESFLRICKNIKAKNTQKTNLSQEEIEQLILSKIKEISVLVNKYSNFVLALIESGQIQTITIIRFLESFYNECLTNENTSNIGLIHFEFAINQMFLYTFALFQKFEFFNLAAEIIYGSYFFKVGRFSSNDTEYSDFTELNFCGNRKTLERILKTQDSSAETNVGILYSRIMEIQKPPLVTLDDIFISDKMLLLITEIGYQRDIFRRTWNPLTYSEKYVNYEFFRRLISGSFCKKVLPVFNMQSIDDLKEGMLKFCKNKTILSESNGRAICYNIPCDSLATKL